MKKINVEEAVSRPIKAIRAGNLMAVLRQTAPGYFPVKNGLRNEFISPDVMEETAMPSIVGIFESDLPTSIF